VCIVTGWREFDDSKVREITESSVTTKAAYVLFYRRRPTPAVPTSVSSASVPSGISAPVPSSSSETAAVPQATEAHHVSHSETTAPADRKSVTEPVPPAQAEFIAPEWQTDMEAID